MDTASQTKTKYTLEYIVAGGYIFFFCLVAFTCLGFFYVNRSLMTPSLPVSNEFAESLPLSTPSPHVLSSHDFGADSILFQDDFINNQNRWLNSQDDTYEYLRNGRLFFHAENYGEYSIISCKACPYLKTPYYLETSLSTNIATDEGYGIVFNRSSTLDDYYLFMINPEIRKYFLFHHTPDVWTLRASGESTLIHPYPKSTTLGLYAYQDTVEFYINGTIVDSYVESDHSFHHGFIGIYANNSWFGVLVEEIAIYEIGE